jgi:hypothetical protein
MTPKAALKKLKGRDRTLNEIRLMLKKRRIKTSVPTLSRILTRDGYQPGYKLSLALLEMAAEKEFNEMSAFVLGGKP